MRNWKRACLAAMTSALLTVMSSQAAQAQTVQTETTQAVQATPSKVREHPEMFSCMTLVVPFHYKCPIAKWDDAWVEVQKGADHGQANKRTAAYMSSGTYAIYDWMLSVSR